MFRPLVRKRITIHLAEGIAEPANQTIRPEAAERALTACKGFAAMARDHDASAVLAVSTGVTRNAAHATELLDLIHEETGVRIRVLTGEEEAGLTGRGVLHSLGVPSGPFMIFDLGGGSTEFLEGSPEKPLVFSLPLGAAVLTQRFFIADPPEERDLASLNRHIDETLRRTFGDGSHEPCEAASLIGTGGTVTTLAAMVHRFGLEAICPERMNGLKLEKGRIEALFANMSNMTVAQRQRLKGMDRGRAAVILAGTTIVMRVLDIFGAQTLTVSLSDLLEGLLVEYLEHQHRKESGPGVEE